MSKLLCFKLIIFALTVLAFVFCQVQLIGSLLSHNDTYINFGEDIYFYTKNYILYVMVVSGTIIISSAILIFDAIDFFMVFHMDGGKGLNALNVFAEFVITGSTFFIIYNRVDEPKYISYGHIYAIIYTALLLLHRIVMIKRSRKHIQSLAGDSNNIAIQGESSVF